MKRLITIFGLSCLVGIVFILTLTLFSERFIDAGSQPVKSTEVSSNLLTDNEVYVNRLEQLRNEYSNVKNVEMDASVVITIINGNSTITGNGQVKYIAQDNKYRYVCTIPENLVNAGLMRNIDVLFNGNKFYFYDSESKIASYQATEEVRLPAALPNPFFFPIDYVGNDDDSCEGCKTRLQDIKMPVRWGKRSTTVSELSTETNNGAVHSLIQMSGGSLNNIPYNFRVRLVGETVNNLQPISISRVKENGIPLVEILLSDMRTVQGINVKVPFAAEVGARDESGVLVMRAVYTINNLKINQILPEGSLSPNFTGSEQFWDSDTKSFTSQ